MVSHIQLRVEAKIHLYGARSITLRKRWGWMDESKTLGLLWLATATGNAAPDTGAASVLGVFFLKTEGASNARAAFFAVGGTLFSWLLLRGRMIPVGLAWLGVLASSLLVVCSPLQLAGLLGGPVTSLI